MANSERRKAKGEKRKAKGEKRKAKSERRKKSPRHQLIPGLSHFTNQNEDPPSEEAPGYIGDEIVNRTLSARNQSRTLK
jgi:hypothetical protein